MTEDDAMTRLCPKSFARDDTDPGGPQWGFMQNCQGSECMAWRPARIANATLHELETKSGYCGLAGEP
ncbi:MAG: hypothetical protein JW395_1807 [Nitrospira sp.]|nr:hypothetical protein [Nitrospira sp.]